MLPVLEQIDRLPTPQREALLAAFGMAEAAEAPDRFLIALAVLELLSDAAEHAPLLVVAEDAHWLGRSTADVLAFVARRVEHEPLVVLVASRDGEESFSDEAGLPELRLGGLDDAAAVALSTAFSQMMAHSPTSTLEASESSTAPFITLALGPTETRPTNAAVGATKAEASTTGSWLRLLISIPTSCIRIPPLWKEPGGRANCYRYPG